MPSRNIKPAFFLTTPEEFETVRSLWHKQYADSLKDNPALASLLESLCDADCWRKRAARSVSHAEASLVMAIDNGAAEADIAKLEKRLFSAIRYRTAAERSFHLALRSVEQFCRARINEDFQFRRLIAYERNTIDQILSRRFRDGRLLPPANDKDDKQKDQDKDKDPNGFVPQNP